MSIFGIIILVVLVLLCILTLWSDYEEVKSRGRHYSDLDDLYDEYPDHYGSYKKSETDEEWAASATEKINKEITQAELKRRDEERSPFRGYTNPEAPEGDPQIAQVAKKELVGASAPQIQPSQLPSITGKDGGRITLSGQDEFPPLPQVQPGEIVNRIIWERDEQMEREHKRVKALGTIDGFPHVVASLKDDHSGPFNDPKMSIYARNYDHNPNRLQTI